MAANARTSFGFHEERATLPIDLDEALSICSLSLPSFRKKKWEVCGWNTYGFKKSNTKQTIRCSIDCYSLIIVKDYYSLHVAECEELIGISERANMSWTAPKRTLMNLSLIVKSLFSLMSRLNGVREFIVALDQENTLTFHSLDLVRS